MQQRWKFIFYHLFKLHASDRPKWLYGPMAPVLLVLILTKGIFSNYYTVFTLALYLWDQCTVQDSNPVAAIESRTATVLGVTLNFKKGYPVDIVK
jgi:hypothetical protein